MTAKEWARMGIPILTTAIRPKVTETEARIRLTVETVRTEMVMTAATLEEATRPLRQAAAVVIRSMRSHD